MKKRLFSAIIAILLVLTSVAFAACNSDDNENSETESESSVPEKFVTESETSDEANDGLNEDRSDISEELDVSGDESSESENSVDEESEDESANDESSYSEGTFPDDEESFPINDAEPDDNETLENLDVIEIGDASGAYVFYPNKTGFYSASFNAVQSDANELSVTLQDGRSFSLEYSEIDYDPEYGVGYTEINGMNFTVTEIIDESDLLCQALDCAEDIKGFDDAVYTISVMFYPELEYGELIIGFVYESENGVYSLKYADGNKSEKKIVYDEEIGAYFFE